MIKNQVYPDWRVDKNISWHNTTTYPMGIIFGLITLEWLSDWKGFKRRLKPWKVWIPPVWATKKESSHWRKGDD